MASNGSKPAWLLPMASIRTHAVQAATVSHGGIRMGTPFERVTASMCVSTVWLFRIASIRKPHKVGTG